MVADNELRFDIIGDASSAADAFTETATTADLAAKGARTLAIALEAQRKAARSSVDATLSLAKADAILAEVQKEESGEAKKERDALLELAAAKKEASGAGSAVGGIGGLSGLSGAAIPALIGGLVAVAPIAVTAGLGLGLFAAAGAEALAPIEKAAQATGGLSANLNMLAGPQRQAAIGLLDLKSDFDAFSKSVQPQVMSVFSSGLATAADVLKGLEPVAKAAGGALGTVLSQVDAEFQSGTWQKFFGWMAQTAGPDVQLLGKDFTDLVHVLPPLLEALQPLGQSLLTDVDVIVKTVGALASLTGEVEKFTATTNQLSGRTDQATKSNKDLQSSILSLLGNAIPEANAANAVRDKMAGAATATGSAKEKTDALSGSMEIAAPKVQSVATQINNLNTALQNLVSPTDDSINKAVTFANDQATLAAALKTSGGAIGLQSQNARDAASAMTQATADAIAYSNSIFSQTRNSQAAIAPLEALKAQIQATGDNSQFAQQELAAISVAIQKLQGAKIVIPITMVGQISGNSAVVQAALASGTYFGGQLTKSVNGMASGGVLTEPVAGIGLRSGQSYLMGEAGPEAVVPLSGSTPVAGVGSGGSGGGTSVRLYVDPSFTRLGLTPEQLNAIRYEVRTKGGGSVQAAFGRG